MIAVEVTILEVVEIVVEVVMIAEVEVLPAIIVVLLLLVVVVVVVVVVVTSTVVVTAKIYLNFTMITIFYPVSVVTAALYLSYRPQFRNLTRLKEFTVLNRQFYPDDTQISQS